MNFVVDEIRIEHALFDSHQSRLVIQYTTMRGKCWLFNRAFCKKVDKQIAAKSPKGIDIRFVLFFAFCHFNCMLQVVNIETLHDKHKVSPVVVIAKWKIERESKG